MAEYITKQQMQELEDAINYGTDEFHYLLEEYTGIKARPYQAYLYFDSYGNYIGDSNDNDLFDLLQAVHIILKEPTADVEEVVRCKDCRYYQDAKINKKGFLICPASGMEISETDYCSYGARMDKEAEQ